MRKTTCSSEPEENEEIAKAFLQQTRGFTAVDAITFLTVAIATALVRTPTPSLATLGAEADSGGTSVRAGVREVRRHAGLTGYLGAQTLASLTFAMFPVLFIAFVVDVLEGDEATVGIIRGMAAFGGIAAAIIVGRLGNRTDPPHLMMWGYIGLGAVALVFVNITGSRLLCGSFSSSSPSAGSRT